MNTKTIDLAVRERLQQLLAGLTDGLYEREQAIKLSLLATLAGESIFLLGPPGVGKSLIARRLKFAFRQGTSFEYLMSKFSTPDEIFGPVSIKKLKEEDKYERLTDRYLPGANIVFLDEIWKAGPAIQNALLTILNERIYRNGEQDIQVDVRGIITASNEIPPDSQRLDPIWDRFLLRLELGDIRQFDHFLRMITETRDLYADTVPEAAKISPHELDEWSERIDAVEVPPEVLNTLQVVKIKIDEYFDRQSGNGYQQRIHDRRWKKIVRLLRTAAFCNGRQAVDLMDCFLMAHCLWHKPGQREAIGDIVRDAIRRHGYSLAVNLNMLKGEMEDFEREVDEEIKVRYTVAEDHPVREREEYYRLEREDKRFEGVLLPIDQYQQLGIEDFKVTNFYDEEANLVNRLQARRRRDGKAVEVSFSGESIILPLRTKKVEREEIVYKKPHPLLIKHWEERHERLSTYIGRQLDKVHEEAPEPVQHLEDNMFVDPAVKEVVLANLEEVERALQSLRLRLDKLRYAYQAEES